MVFYDKKKLEQQSTGVRANATQAQLAVMDGVQAEIDKENAVLQQRYEAEDALRKWAKDLLGFSVNVSQIEAIRTELTKAANGSTVDVMGPNGVITLYKTQYGAVDRLDRYVTTLEKTIIDITNNSQFTALGFYDLIKLAFKKLLRRK